MAPEDPQVFDKFADILDYKPAYQVIALFSPIGLLDEALAGGRACEREARRLLGWPRSAAVASAPVRTSLRSATYEEAVAANGGHLNPVRWRQFAKIADVDKEIAPYRQRTVFEVHPELSFFQLNEDHALRYPKHSAVGMEERRHLLSARLPGAERVLEARIPRITTVHLLDAAACLWTARRIVSRAISRLPEDPVWDGLGLRMELVR